MTLNFGLLLLALRAKQQKMSAAMLNALRADMVTILNAPDSWRKLSVAFALSFQYRESFARAVQS